jgi:hypothetical protein
MDYKFLHKVVDQLVYETMIDYDRKVIESPFISPSYLNPFLALVYILPSFSFHCRDVYGLNYEEMEYVWKEYNDDIVYKISQNY